ncbi:tetratricopeptide repeat protein [Micromonospora endolithica]|uniref:Tetratricopeptide repeat protein n=1 Tax=Micromonospora endolithica TaxID=230091 RepID=A0A3A9ZM76_9ACTN|nr:tetratricopeptide repeat protein [Micromonospora endolithica]RKN49401.1 hypothetical protein D7223_07870 [Micromonospora endolithica]TWJ23594.1 hypothetical protein JD76_03733 [Micromonospora endolithica]
MSLVVRIALLRPLARIRPRRWGPPLVEALVTRSHLVSGLPGGTARRAAAAEEAVAWGRRLVAAHPERHRVALARALVAQAGVPDDRPMADAVAQLTEAIGYVEDVPDRAALVALATARGLLARNRHATGDVREALRLALRARTTWAAAEPLGPDERMRRAVPLLVIGDCRTTLAHPAAALAVRQQTWDTYRQLSRWHRLRWTAVGARAAVDLADSLTATGRHREALDLLAASAPDRELLRSFAPEHGRPLGVAALLVEAVGRREAGEAEQAERAAATAVDQVRPLVDRAPGVDSGTLAGALRVHGQLLLASGRPDDGVARLVEAVEAARDRNEVELARALIPLAGEHIRAGRWEQTEPLLEELLAVCRQEEGELPEVFRPLLVDGLHLVLAVTAFARPDGSTVAPDTRVAGMTGVRAGREAVALARKLATADPVHRPTLGRSLFGLERALDRAGDVAGAAELLRECVAVRRELSAENPAAHLADLSQALGNLGNRLHRLGLLDEALEAHRESVAVIRTVDSGLPPAEIATALRNMARTLAALDRAGEAERAITEADALFDT